MAITTKSSTTEVKYVKDGTEQKQDVPYTAKQVTDLEGAMELASEAIPAIGESFTEDGKEVKVTEDNRTDLMANWILAKVNQVLESNARQAARAAFLNTVAGPDKQITQMAKRLVAVLAMKGETVTEAEAEKRIRAQFGI